MTEFCFIRHGEADYSETGSKFYRNQGAFLCTLSEKGIEQAKLAAKDERFAGADIIISSPFGRTLHTAAILSKELNLDIKVESDLHEWLADIDEYSYLDDETAARHYREFEAGNGNYPEGETRQWESADKIRKRVFSVLEKYESYDKVIVVSHGTLMKYCLNIEHPNNCEIAIFRK